MSNKYDQLKKNMKHFSETYSPGILVSTLDSARVAITDLQEEIESLKAITELAVKGLRESKIALKHTASLAHLPSCTCPPCNAIGFVEYTLSEIENSQNV